MSYDTDNYEIDAPATPTVPKNTYLFKGIKRQTVQSFVQYLKKELPGHANPDMTITIEPFTTNDLELLAGDFLNGRE